jgi:hypothetical protein
VGYQIEPVEIGADSPIRYGFGRVRLDERASILVVRFEGTAGEAEPHLMTAVVDFGVSFVRPRGVVLDLRGLTYRGGDRMSAPLDAARRRGRAAVVVSDLCRAAITTLVEMELMARPEEWVFDDPDRAIEAVAETVRRRGGPGRR